MIGKLQRVIRHERSLYAMLAVTRLAFEQTIGRVLCRLLGWPGSYLGPGSRIIGSKHICVSGSAYINRYAWIEVVHTFRGQEFKPIIKIGHRFAASDRLHISCVNLIEIGDDCLFGSSVYIGDHNHGCYKGAEQSSPAQAPSDRKLFSSGPVIVGSNVWIGDNVVIIGPVTIGDGTVIGANSTVTKDIQSNAIAGGNPARLLKVYDSLTQKWELIKKLDQN